MAYQRTSFSIVKGKPIAIKEYTNWRYRVSIAADGAIKVKPRDWLSKYSAAIHDDFGHVHEYGRRSRRSGVIEPIQNVNLIQAGETIYHLPTIKMRVPPPRPIPEKRVRREEIKKMLAESRVSLPGEFAINDYLDAADVISNGVEVVSTFVEMSEAVEVAGGLAGIVLAMIGNIGDFLQDRYLSEQLYGLIGICYAATAWGYQQQVPSSCGIVLDRARHDANVLERVSMHSSRVESLNDTWQQATAATIRRLETNARLRREKAQTPLAAVASMRATITGVGGKPVDTCANLMKEIPHTKSFAFFIEWENVTAKRAWDSLLTEVRYPN